MAIIQVVWMINKGFFISLISPHPSSFPPSLPLSFFYFLTQLCEEVLQYFCTEVWGGSQKKKVTLSISVYEESEKATVF